MDGLLDRMQRATGVAEPALDASGAARLADYCQAVVRSPLNLTAFRDPEPAFDALVLGSLAVRAAWTRSTPPGLALDIGSGNGFPGVAVAVLWPGCAVLLVERRAKKARAIEACLGACGIANAQARACDVRELARLEPTVVGAVDLATARAVGPLGRTTRLAGALLAPGGRIVHWKAAALDAGEREEGARVAGAMDLECLAEIERPQGEGRLVIYERPESLR